MSVPQSEIGLHSTIRAREDNIWCELGGEAVILNLKTGIYYGLNPVGASVWALLRKPLTVAEILSGITAEYEVSRDDVLRDVRKLLSQMAAEGIVEVSGGHLER